MKKIFKILVVILLTPIYCITFLFIGMFEFIEPLAQDVGNSITRPFIEVCNSMYRYWKKVFKWRD